MKSDNLLLVPDALKDPEWDNNPEIPAGFVYYLGYPIHWPAGKMFGTICVQDYENNPHATDNKGLLEEFRSVCELDLLMVQMRMDLEGIVAERTLKLQMAEERSRRTVEERLRFQELISNISNKFVGLTGVEFERAIQDTLEEIGRYFNSDTVRLYRLSLKGDVLKIRNQWQDKHLAPPEEMAEIHKMKYPNLAAHYSKGEATVFSKFDDSPKWPEMRKILKFFGTKAGVGVPLEVDSSGVDVFAMDKVQSEYVWPENIVEQSIAIGKVILSAMRRREAEVELQDSYDEIKRLKKHLEQENIYLRKEIEINYHHDEIVGDSDILKGVLSQAEMVASQNTSVLILGDTGTGKELLAHAIHNMSPRKARTMIKVNCAALPATLVESELFGREKGAFTGALAKQIGRFEAANGSTIFLDEIGDLPLEIQAKLLRVLHDGEFERLGSTRTISVDVRVIAATNRDLKQALRENRFRRDLFYRLSVFPITIPPLRERQEDIPLLVWTFVKQFGKSMGKTFDVVPKKTMDMLQSYSWPGNVRELKNVIERAMILSTDQTLHVDRIKPEDLETERPMRLEDAERNHILQILNKTDWKVSGKNGAAKILGLKESTLRAKMGKLGIKREK
jgi:transcriptional regulator with GAF, ATPase, and Fis domain